MLHFVLWLAYLIASSKVGGKQKPYEMWQAGISLAASRLAKSLASLWRLRRRSPAHESRQLRRLSANTSLFSYILRIPFIMTQRTGMIRVNATFLGERMGLTKKRPSYRPIGTHPSLRFVSEWRLANGLTLLSSTNRPILCTHWSPTGNTVPPNWVVSRGRRWLVRRLLYSSIVTEKASTLWVLTS